MGQNILLNAWRDICPEYKRSWCNTSIGLVPRCDRQKKTKMLKNSTWWRSVYSIDYILGLSHIFRLVIYAIYRDNLGTPQKQTFVMMPYFWSVFLWSWKRSLLFIWAIFSHDIRCKKKKKKNAVGAPLIQHCLFWVQSKYFENYEKRKPAPSASKVPESALNLKTNYFYVEVRSVILSTDASDAFTPVGLSVSDYSVEGSEASEFRKTNQWCHLILTCAVTHYTYYKTTRGINNSVSGGKIRTRH